MPYRRQDASYLRRKAQQFRALANIEAGVSPKLRGLADALDKYAAEIERRPEPPKAA
jgi:hypothetical protein